jgi:hypothetical protein
MVVCAPIPGYITTKCCTNGLQIENFGSADFECEVATAGVNTLQDVLEGWAEHKRFLMQQ